MDRPAAVLLVEAAALLVIGSLALRRHELVAAAVPVLGAAGLLAAPALGATYPVALASLVGLAALLLVGGGLLDARGRLLPGWAALGTGAVLLALAASWALADDVTTLLTLPAVALTLLAGAVAARGPQEMRPWRVALVATSLLVVVAEAAALARYDGAGWPAVWSLALGLLAAVAAAAALALSLRTAPGDVFWAPLHTAVVCRRRGGHGGRRGGAGPVGRQHARGLRPRGRRHRGGPDGADGGAAADPPAGARRGAGRGRARRRPGARARGPRR